jgi:hypothetical protein
MQNAQIEWAGTVTLKSGVAVGLVVIAKIVKIQAAMDRRHGRLQADVLCRAVAGEHHHFALLFRWQLAFGFKNIERVAHALGAGGRAGHRRIDPRRVERR